MNGNQIDDKLAELIAFLKADYMFSGESERIQNAKRNDEKYELLCKTWKDCYELANRFKGKLDGNNPDFPCGCHLIRLVLPTEDDEIVLREIKSQLADSISNCDEVNIDTDIKGNVRIHFGFEDVYTEQ